MEQLYQGVEKVRPIMRALIERRRVIYCAHPEYRSADFQVLLHQELRSPSSDAALEHQFVQLVENERRLRDLWGDLDAVQEMIMDIMEPVYQAPDAEHAGEMSH